MQRPALVLLAALGLSSACRQHPVEKAMLDNLDLIGLVMRTRYAPEAFKHERFHWSVDDELKGAGKVVRSASFLNCRQYQDLVRGVFESARDYHAAALFDNVETKMLPFSVKGGRDQTGAVRYFVVHVDEGWKDKIRIGAELTTFGTQPTALAVEELMKQIRRSSEPSDRGLATMLLTMRRAEAGVPIPHDPEIAIVLDSKTQLTVPWRHLKEDVECPIVLDRARPERELRELQPVTPVYPLGALDNFRVDGEFNAQEAARVVLGRMVVHPWYASLLSLERDTNPHGWGRKESFFPPLGKQVWVAAPDSPYFAYIYELGKHRVGLLRVADFLQAGSDAKATAFGEIIKKMEKDAEALVIDQFNNPGGSLLHVYALLSMLSPKELSVLPHRVTLDRQEALYYKRFGRALEDIDTPEKAEAYRKAQADYFGGYPFSLTEVKQFRSYAAFVLQQFAILSPRSVKVLTPSAALMGIEKVAPSTKAVYSKPLLVLVNELDFSGADFFPAILQDSRRATLMGARTGGAGGFIIQMKYPNPFGIAGFSITSSLASRADGSVLENNGVEPELKYELSARDLQENYEELVADVNRNVLKLLGS